MILRIGDAKSWGAPAFRRRHSTPLPTLPAPGRRAAGPAHERHDLFGDAVQLDGRLVRETKTETKKAAQPTVPVKSQLVDRLA